MLLQDELIEGLSAPQPILILDEYTLSMLRHPNMVPAFKKVENELG